MSKYKMISPAVPNVPWQERPEGITLQEFLTVR